MLQLLKLELKKFNFGWYVKGAIIANVRAMFIVFASVLIAKIVIEEYKNKTICCCFLILLVERKLSQVN